MGFFRWLIGLIDEAPGQRDIVAANTRWMAFAGRPTRVSDGSFMLIFDDRRQSAFVSVIGFSMVFREKRYDGRRAAALQRAIADLVRDGGLIDVMKVEDRAA